MPIVKKTRGGSNNSKPAVAEKSSPVSLPTQANEPPQDLHRYSLFIYGEKGIGKSLLSALLAGHDKLGLTFQFERGRKNLPIIQVPDTRKNEPPLTWARFKDYCQLMLDQGKPRTIVIDTMDRAYDLCFKHVCKGMGIQHPSGLGRDSHMAWNGIKNEYELQMADLIDGGIIPIFTSHSRLKDVAKADGMEFTMIQPTLSDAPLNVAKSITDLAIYLGYGPHQSRIVYVRGDSFIWGACNIHNHFLTPNGEEVHRIDGGYSGEEMAANLLKSFNNKLPDYNPDPEPADEEESQVDESPPPKSKRKKE